MPTRYGICRNPSAALTLSSQDQITVFSQVEKTVEASIPSVNFLFHSISDDRTGGTCG
jgi:hypothetical protein